MINFKVGILTPYSDKKIKDVTKATVFSLIIYGGILSIDEIKAEIYNNRPFAIIVTTGGLTRHVIVCQGYDGTTSQLCCLEPKYLESDDHTLYPHYGDLYIGSYSFNGTGYKWDETITYLEVS